LCLNREIKKDPTFGFSDIAIIYNRAYSIRIYSTGFPKYWICHCLALILYARTP
jgi:hypothetical protein